MIQVGKPSSANQSDEISSDEEDTADADEENEGNDVEYAIKFSFG